MSVPIGTDESSLLRQVETAMQRWMEGEREALIQKYVKDFEERLRSVVASSVLKLHNFYQVEMIGSQLVIKVEIGERK